MPAPRIDKPMTGASGSFCLGHLAKSLAASLGSATDTEVTEVTDRLVVQQAKSLKPWEHVTSFHQIELHIAYIAYISTVAIKKIKLHGCFQMFPDMPRYAEMQFGQFR